MDGVMPAEQARASRGHSKEEDERLSRLMQAAQAGDNRAYAALLQDVAVLLRRFVRSRRRGSDPSDLEDVIQDIMISLHAVRATYDPSRPFTPWLLAIARNRLVDAARRYGRGLSHESKDYDVVLSLYTQDRTERDDGFDKDALMSAIQRLPSSQRRAIELMKLQELSLDEASKATGSTVGSLKLLVHRAMKNLRKTMGGV